MNRRQPKVAVIGAGSWGTAVASIVARKSPTVIWARSKEVATQINETHTNSRYLPDFPLPDTLTALMRDIGLPAGVGAVGFGEQDVGDLVDGALKQQRLLATAPRNVTAEDLDLIFRRSMMLW